MSKHDALRDLGTKRRLTCWVGYKGIGDFHSGIYECEFVSPYSKSAGNADASVMVVLQDWSSEKKLAKPVDEDARTLGYTRRLLTNRNLVALLRSHLELEFSEVFATNLFPFIKPGDMTDPIPEPDLVRAATEFAIPQIEIVGPRIVICLGLATFNAIRVAFGLERVSVLEEGLESPFSLGDAQVWCQAHTGYWGRINRNRGGINRVDQDWARMAREFRRR